MVVLSRKKMEPARSERVSLARFGLVAQTEAECAGDHGKALVLRMPVRRNLVPGRHHEANHEWPRLAGIALQDRDFCALRHRGRGVAPFNVLGIDEALFFALSLSQCRRSQG